ncbi:MAG: Na(+)/H(+) antiporter subunit B [Alphaproteobacteria bacterium]|nr:Na(+)/H(+) antiporter subunit B [Alphaproteobacteria bacterium]
MRRDVILRIGVKLVLPFILLFGFYVHFHGDYGPGGGFQAGVIIAAAVILYALVFGISAAKRAVPVAVVERLVPLGVLIYLVAGLPALIAGRPYLDYGVYGSDPLHAHEWGVFLVEAGVITTVASTMIIIFYSFVDRGRS